MPPPLFLHDADWIARKLGLRVVRKTHTHVTYRRRGLWYLYPYAIVEDRTLDGQHVRMPAQVMNQRAAAKLPTAAKLMDAEDLPARRNASRGYLLISQFGGVVLRIQPVTHRAAAEASPRRRKLKMEVESIGYYTEITPKSKARGEATWADVKDLLEGADAVKLMDAAATPTKPKAPLYHAFHRTALVKGAAATKSQMYDAFVQYPPLASTFFNFVKSRNSPTRTELLRAMDAHGYANFLKRVAALPGAPGELAGRTANQVNVLFRRGAKTETKSIVPTWSGGAKATYKLRSYAPGEYAPAPRTGSARSSSSSPGRPLLSARSPAVIVVSPSPERESKRRRVR